MTINLDTVCRLADKYAQQITASPESDIEYLLRKLVLEAMDIGANSAFDAMRETFSAQKQVAS